MFKHKYEVSGIYGANGMKFLGTCISNDIIDAIQLFHEKDCSVWSIEKKEQVNREEEIGIKSLCILGGYFASGESRLADTKASDILSNSAIIDDSGEYESWYSDSPGGAYYRIKVLKYGNEFYVYKELIQDCPKKTECVAFYKLK